MRDSTSSFGSSRFWSARWSAKMSATSPAAAARTMPAGVDQGKVVLGRAHLAEDAAFELAVVPTMSPKANVPRLAHRAIRPMIMPKSPTRLTMKALLAAFDALLRSM